MIDRSETVLSYLSDGGERQIHRHGNGSCPFFLDGGCLKYFFKLGQGIPILEGLSKDYLQLILFRLIQYF